LQLLRSICTLLYKYFDWFVTRMYDIFNILSKACQPFMNMGVTTL